jgi:uncharacterized protein (TIGR02246 family)
MHPIQQAIEAADRAISGEDFETLMDFYADDAALVVKPGMIATGKEQIRRAFAAIAAHFGHALAVRQGEMQIIQGGDTALVVMETILETAGSCITRRATYVFREESDGRWLCVVDNSYGTDLLGAT